MFDPEHGPDDYEDVSDSINRNEKSEIPVSAVSGSYNPALKATFGGDSFDDRDDESDITNAAKMYKSYVRKFDQKFQGTEGLGGIKEI